MSEIKVNSIKGVGATNAAITVNNSDGTCTANLSNRQGKNLILNGAFQIAQRGVSSTINNYGTVDRFESSFLGTDESPTQEQVTNSSSDTPYTIGLTRAFKITNGNQTSGAGAADYIRIRHRIEAQNIRNSGWNYKSPSSFITISFWVKSSVAQTFYLQLRTYDGTAQNYAHPFSATTSWTKITHTIPGNSNLDFNDDVGIGLELQWAMFYGTDYTDNSRADNTWSAFASATQTKDHTSTWYTTNDATFEITGVQLEVSDHATSFEHKSFDQVYHECLRYTYVINVHDTDTVDRSYGYAYSTSYVHGMFYLPRAMRIYPSYTATETDVNFYASNNSAFFHLDDIAGYVGSLLSPFPNTFHWRVTTTSITAGDAGILLGREAGGKITFDAEL
tara:strand:- start:226 stop:1398 length:1173 start_codon:yes stop_codon:yes gene_type:complete